MSNIFFHTIEILIIWYCKYNLFLYIKIFFGILLKYFFIYSDG